jgi:hypothetical protein
MKIARNFSFSLYFSCSSSFFDYSLPMHTYCFKYFLEVFFFFAFVSSFIAFMCVVIFYSFSAIKSKFTIKISFSLKYLLKSFFFFVDYPILFLQHKLENEFQEFKKQYNYFQESTAL